MLQEGVRVGLADFQCFNFWAARNPLSRYLWRNLRPVLDSSRCPLNGSVLTTKKYLQSKKLKFWFSLPQNQLLFVAYLQLMHYILIIGACFKRINYLQRVQTHPGAIIAWEPIKMTIWPCVTVFEGHSTLKTRRARHLTLRAGWTW